MALNKSDPGWAPEGYKPSKPKPKAVKKPVKKKAK